jgi:hypothetical protein
LGNSCSIREICVLFLDDLLLSEPSSETTICQSGINFVGVHNNKDDSSPWKGQNDKHRLHDEEWERR